VLYLCGEALVSPLLNDTSDCKREIRKERGIVRHYL
jgi:hypothetical protein